MVEDGQQTKLATLKLLRAQAIEDVKVEEALEKQREVLRPQLEDRRKVLVAKLAPLNAQLTAVDDAMTQIKDGELTDYRLRKPRRKKGARPAGEGE